MMINNDIYNHYFNHLCNDICNKYIIDYNMHERKPKKSKLRYFEKNSTFPPQNHLSNQLFFAKTARLSLRFEKLFLAVIE